MIAKPRTKYAIIARAVRSRILRGDIAPGERAPSERELSTSFNASLSTVRHALELLAQEDLIVRRGRSGSYVTDPSQRHTKVLGLAVVDTYDPEYPWLSKVMVLAAGRLPSHGMALQLVFYSKDSVGTTSMPKLKVDGLLLATERFPKSLQQMLAGRSVPTVFISFDPLDSKAFCVVPDTFSGMYQATRHLAELKHRRIALLVGSALAAPVSPTVLSYRAAMTAAGLDFDERYVVASDWTRPAGREAAIKLLSRPDPPTAIIAADDILASGVLDACAERNLRVPRDISVVGFANLLRPEWHGVALTTVDVGLEHMVTQAIDMVATLILGESPRKRRAVVPCQLIKRRTTGECPTKR